MGFEEKENSWSAPDHTSNFTYFILRLGNERGKRSLFDKRAGRTAV